jgi:hypothetical protein
MLLTMRRLSLFFSSATIKTKNMKTLTLFFIFTSLCTHALKAQSTGGFFSQQSSKEKTMLQQIASLESQLHTIKTGYNISQNGLNAMHDLKGGTLSLNEAYFTSLSQVSSAVKNNPKVQGTIDLQRQTITVFNKEIAWQNQQKQLTPLELAYIKSVYDNLLKKSQEDLDELNMVITPGKMQLTDHERLNRIDKLYEAMQEKYAFTCSFTKNCHTVATGRQGKKRDDQQMKQLYGVN